MAPGHAQGDGEHLGAEVAGAHGTVHTAQQNKAVGGDRRHDQPQEDVHPLDIFPNPFDTT